MNHEQARVALSEGATVREKSCSGGCRRTDFKLIDGKIHSRFVVGDSVDRTWVRSSYFYAPETKKSTFTKLKPAWPKWYGDRLSQYRADSEHACTAFYAAGYSVERTLPAEQFSPRRLSRAQAAKWLRANGHTAEADKIDPPKKPQTVSLLKAGQDFQSMTPAELDKVGYGKLAGIPTAVCPAPAQYPLWIRHKDGDQCWYRQDGPNAENLPYISLPYSGNTVPRNSPSCYSGGWKKTEDWTDNGFQIVPQSQVEEALAKIGWELKNGVAVEKAKPVGLYSKFEVTKGGKPLDAGCFVLVPFNKDGSVNDPAAVKALSAYRAWCHGEKLSTDIAAWINDPTSRNGMNAPDKYEPIGTLPQPGDFICYPTSSHEPDRGPRVCTGISAAGSAKTYLSDCFASREQFLDGAGLPCRILKRT